MAQSGFFCNGLLGWDVNPNIFQYKAVSTQLMLVTQTKPQFLTEALIEVLNNQWKVDGIESGRSVYTQLEYEVGRKYIKIWSYLVVGGDVRNGRDLLDVR